VKWGDMSSERAQEGDGWLPQPMAMRFRPAASPIREPVAKLGGQPVWLDAPTWPTIGNAEAPMVFVGQFPIPGADGRMAYLFVGDEDYVDLTFEPEGGGNALLVQPGGRVPGFVTVTESSTGPTLWRRGASWDEHVPVELHVDFVPLSAAEESANDAEREGTFLELPEDAGPPPYSYRGGRPCTWQPQVPVPSPWRFMFQLNGADGVDDEPYALNFGGGTAATRTSHPTGVRAASVGTVCDRAAGSGSVAA
jgi:hypothetical protein